MAIRRNCSRSMGDLLLRGYTMMAEVCDECQVPLMRDPATRVCHCVNCDAQYKGGVRISPSAPNTPDVEKETLLASPQQKDGKSTVQQSKSATMVDAVKIPSSSAGHVQAARPQPDPDAVTEDISSRLLQGWALSDIHCPLCVTPLVREKGTRKLFCCGCDMWVMTEKEAAERNLLQGAVNATQPAKDATGPAGTAAAASPASAAAGVRSAVTNTAAAVQVQDRQQELVTGRQALEDATKAQTLHQVEAENTNDAAPLTRGRGVASSSASLGAVSSVMANKFQEMQKAFEEQMQSYYNISSQLDTTGGSSGDVKSVSDRKQQEDNHNHSDGNISSGISASQSSRPDVEGTQKPSSISAQHVQPIVSPGAPAPGTSDVIAGPSLGASSGIFAAVSQPPPAGKSFETRQQQADHTQDALMNGTQSADPVVSVLGELEQAVTKQLQSITQVISSYNVDSTGSGLESLRRLLQTSGECVNVLQQARTARRAM